MREDDMVCCLLFVVCCLLFVVCCLLFVVCLPHIGRLVTWDIHWSFSRLPSWPIPSLSLHASRATSIASLQPGSRRDNMPQFPAMVLSILADARRKDQRVLAFDKSVENNPITMYTFARRQPIALNTPRFPSASSTLAHRSP